MGFPFSGEQCSIKWRSLKASFLKSKITSSQRDKPSPWIHFQAMAEALDDDAVTLDNSFSEQPAHNNHHHEDDDGGDDEDLDIKPDSLQNPAPPHPPLTHAEGSQPSEEEEEDGEEDGEEERQDEDYGDGEDHSTSSKRKKCASKSLKRMAVSTGGRTGKKKKKKDEEDEEEERGEGKSEWQRCFREMKAEWKTRRDERRRMHEERMELGRRKISVMEELITLLRRK